MTPVPWSPAERAAWSWPERIGPVEWCDRNVCIPDNSLNAEPGLYDSSRTPYVRGILEAAVDPIISEIWVYKATQVGLTRLAVNLICYWADQDPGATGYLLPDEDEVEDFFSEEVVPTLDASKTMQRHKSAKAWDNKKRAIWLDTMPIFGLYAGSIAKLGRRSLRNIIADEIDKYRPFRNEASPIQLLKKRQSNWKYRRPKGLFFSSPTTPDGNIAAGYNTCPDQREYWIPCIRCGKYQRVQWFQVKGFKDAPGSNKFEKANWIRLHKPAFYECENCRQPIEDKHKMTCVGHGTWVSGSTKDGKWAPCQNVADDGKLVGPRPEAARVGFHLTSLVSPWLTFSDLAAEFVEAEGDHDKSRDFRNSRLALPWDEVVKTVRPSAIRDKIPLSGPPLIVPKWTVSLIATFDTQKDWFAGCIRAWGYGLKSALVWYGECQTFDEVYRIGLESRFDVEGGGHMSPKAILIDSGGTNSRTSEVYEFALRDNRIYPTKGASNRIKSLFSRTQLGNGVELRVIDTIDFKDMLARLIADPDRTKWLPHRDVSEQYCLEMAGEHKIIDPKTKKDRWVPTGSGRVEAWDCEVLQCAAAFMDNVAVQDAPQQDTRPKFRIE